MFVLVLVFLASCGSKGDNLKPNQVEEAYSVTHQVYLGRAIVTVDGSGKLDVEIDDAFLPHTLAVVNLDNEMWNTTNTVKFSNYGQEVYSAKYIEYLGVTYVGVSVGKGISYIETDRSGNASELVGLERRILRDQKSMKEYFDSVPMGKLKLLYSFGGEGEPVTKSFFGGFTKKSSKNYWNFGQTWVGNIKEIEKFIEEYGYRFSLNEMVKAQESNTEDDLLYWSVVDTVTGATNMDFKDYFNLVQNAAGRLKVK